jgi:hypothetical protein
MGWRQRRRWCGRCCRQRQAAAAAARLKWVCCCCHAGCAVSTRVHAAIDPQVLLLGNRKGVKCRRRGLGRLWHGGCWRSGGCHITPERIPLPCR